MNRSAIMISLCFVSYLFQACVPVTYTAYNLNRYRLGRTLGSGRVHFTTSVASAPYLQDVGESAAIVSSVHSGGGALSGELTIGLAARTDLNIGLAYGSGSNMWNVSLQQQLTPREQPFALSIAPGMTFVNGVRDQQDFSWIDSRMTVTELRIPMSYRLGRYGEFLWSTGLLYFHHRAIYGNDDGVSRQLSRDCLTALGSFGLRLGFLTLEATTCNFYGDPTTTAGGAFRFHF